MIDDQEMLGLILSVRQCRVEKAKFRKIQAEKNLLEGIKVQNEASTVLETSKEIRELTKKEFFQNNVRQVSAAESVQLFKRNDDKLVHDVQLKQLELKQKTVDLKNLEYDRGQAVENLTAHEKRLCVTEWIKDTYSS